MALLRFLLTFPGEIRAVVETHLRSLIIYGERHAPFRVDMTLLNLTISSRYNSDYDGVCESARHAAPAILQAHFAQRALRRIF